MKSQEKIYSERRLLVNNTTDMLSTEIEFFTVDGAIFYKMGNVVKVFHVDSHEMINFVLDGMQQFYPKAFEALADCYKACKPNPAYYKYRIAARFIKCNFAALDNKADIENRWFGTFEYVNCPMRGECRLQGIVCSPEFNHRLSPAELRVLRLVYDGLPEHEIAGMLFISPHTVHTHIRNAYTRIGVHSRAEFVKYIEKYKLF